MGEILMDADDITPQSPQQSDSEGSTSSLELGSGVANIALSGTPTSVQEAVMCRWQHCGLWFMHLDQLAAHVTVVHAAAGQGGLFYCGWEGCSRGHRGFNARYKMLVHVRTHTNEKPHRCNKCDKSFSRAENLKIHARSHTGERPYTCPVPGCNKAYSNSSDRFKHTRTHAVDKPYVCKVEGCPKRYTDPSSLRKHVKTYRHFPGAAATPSPQGSPQASPSAPSPLAPSVHSDEESRSAFRVVAAFPEARTFSPASTERAPLPGEYRKASAGIPIKKSISARVRQSELDSGSVSDCDQHTDGSLSPPAQNQRTWAGGSVWVGGSVSGWSMKSEEPTGPSSPHTLSPSSSPTADWPGVYPVPGPLPGAVPMDVYRSWLDSSRSLPWALPLWSYPPVPVPASCATSAAQEVAALSEEQVMPLDLTVARH